MRRIALAALLVVPAVAPARDFSEPGRWAVGTTTIPFTKASETTGLPRVLETRFWYPTKRGNGGATPRQDAPVARRRWPLVVFSHGSCGIPDQSSFLTAGLASWGFVVAAPPHPGNTTFELPQCEDRAEYLDSFQNRVADVRFVIDQLLAAGDGSPFAGRIDPRRIGMSGHSFGGQTTLRVLAADDRVRAGVALAPTVMDIADLRITRPAMVFTGAIDSITPFAVDARGAYALLAGPRFLLELDAAGHCAFAGACFTPFCGTGCAAGDLSPTATHRETLRYAVPFLLHYVANKPIGKALSPKHASPPVRILESHPK